MNGTHKSFSAALQSSDTTWTHMTYTCYYILANYNIQIILRQASRRACCNNLNMRWSKHESIWQYSSASETVTTDAQYLQFVFSFKLTIHVYLIFAFLLFCFSDIDLKLLLQFSPWMMFYVQSPLKWRQDTNIVDEWVIWKVFV